MERERVESSQPHDLVELARLGDRDAFGELVRIHQHEVYTLAVRLVRDRDLASDVTQDAFVRAWRAMPKFRGDAKFSTCWADRSGTHTSPIDKDEVDLYCIYCPDTDECYYLRPRDFGSNVSLRVRAPKNGQAKRVNFAADFRRAP